jgi:CheY-like chemotaxis protein
MKRRILLIDDEPFLLKVLLVRLKHWGYDALGAENGPEGFAIMRKNKPDLIILDKEMPGMNGEDVVRIVRRDPELKQIPIIMISADVENIQACAKACGIEHYLTKPCEPEDLLEIIQMQFNPSENCESL